MNVLIDVEELSVLREKIVTIYLLNELGLGKAVKESRGRFVRAVG